MRAEFAFLHREPETQRRRGQPVRSSPDRRPLAERLGVRLRWTPVDGHVARTFPSGVAALRELEARHGGRRYTFDDGTEVTCSGAGTPIAACGETLWPVALLSSGERLYLDARGALYTWHEMDGVAERLDDTFDSWLAWTARDAARGAPAPPRPDVTGALAAALVDLPAEAVVRGGAASSTDLEALLADLGLRASPPLVEAEERWGGLVARWIRVGPFQMLRDADFSARRTARLGDAPGVLVGQMHDALLYLAPDGALWRVSALDRGGVPRRVASSPSAWLARAALVHQLCEQSAIVVRTAGIEPRALATIVGAEAAGPERVWAREDAIVLEGADPFASGAVGASVYVGRSEVATALVRAIGARGGACRLASAPWPSTWSPVLRSRFDDALAPALGRMARHTSPTVTRQVRAASEAPRLETWADATPLLPAWPREGGVVRCRDGAIEQVRGVGGRVVITQHFAEEWEHQLAFTGLPADGVERDPRWLAAASSGLSEPATGIERRRGGLRWRRREGGRVVEGWLGLGASQRWGHAPLTVDGAPLLPLGEEGAWQLFLAPTGGVWRRLAAPHPAICHPGNRPHEAAVSVEAFVAARLGLL